MSRPTRSNHTPDSDAALAHRIGEGLVSLGLLRMRQSLDDSLAAPASNQTRLQWLWTVLEPQLIQRVESRIERRIRESRLPDRKTLEAFDFTFQPTLDRNLVLELGTLAFLREGRNVLLAGWSGTGKSHIAKALALNACMANHRVRYTTSADMLANLNASVALGTLADEVKEYTRPELLVIDEVGLEQVERLGAVGCGLMQKVLMPRYNDRRSTIITSNIDWENWGDYLEDQLGVTALLDRLIHYSHVIVINGPSYRDREHQEDVRRRGTPAKAPDQEQRGHAPAGPRKNRRPKNGKD